LLPALVKARVRRLCSGKTLAFQAKDAGSIPARRSIPLCFIQLNQLFVIKSDPRKNWPWITLVFYHFHCPHYGNSSFSISPARRRFGVGPRCRYAFMTMDSHDVIG
jgi:hypothetical protein